jgi:hypothetical protein
MSPRAGVRTGSTETTATTQKEQRAGRIGLIRARSVQLHERGDLGASAFPLEEHSR